jgi:hypothetical protein
MALPPFVGPWPLLQFRNLFYTDGRTPWTVDHYLHTGQHNHRIKTHTDIHALRGFEPTIPAFGRAKTVHALDSVATVIGT